MSNSLEEARGEKEKTQNRLQVLEKYFKEREEEYIKTIEQLQLKESVRDKGKEELIKIIEEKEHVNNDLNERLEALKDEFEETKQQHRNEIRTLEGNNHENWVRNWIFKYNSIALMDISSGHVLIILILISSYLYAKRRGKHKMLERKPNCYVNV